jgi:hypothetical protein
MRRISARYVGSEKADRYARGNTTEGAILYRIKERSGKFFYETPTGFWVRIGSIEREHYCGDVYNLQTINGTYPPTISTRKKVTVKSLQSVQASTSIEARVKLPR